LHVLTNEAVARRPDLARQASAVARAGRLALHARGPALTGREHAELARTVATAVQGTSALLFVNDRADLARLAGAHGLHLPAAGLPVPAARAVLGPGVVIGRSVHSLAEIESAMGEGADYLMLGPVFATASHPGAAPVGLDLIARAQPLPVIAIGGITAERVPQCLDAGAYGVAVIRAVWDAPDAGTAARIILLSLNQSGQ
jgi:thiamine-phosphate diphosphorylase